MLTHRGAFIVFCGLGGSGKSHQADLLAQHINRAGLQTVVTGQPTSWYKDSSLARRFFDTLQCDQMEIAALALLSAADRLKHIHDVVTPALQAGQIVICTRYYLSAYAYFPERGLDAAEWLRNINRYAPPPDITFLLDIPAQVAQERIRDRDHSVQLEEEQLARMEAVRQRFLTFDERCYHILDGTEPPGMIHERVLQLVEPLLLKNRGSEYV